MKRSLKDLTPTKYKCAGASSMCPAVLQRSAKTYIIIGKTLDPSAEDSLVNRVGDGETAIEISAQLLEEALSNK